MLSASVKVGNPTFLVFDSAKIPHFHAELCYMIPPADESGRIHGVRLENVSVYHSSTDEYFLMFPNNILHLGFGAKTPLKSLVNLMSAHDGWTWRVAQVPRFWAPGRPRTPTRSAEGRQPHRRWQVLVQIISHDRRIIVTAARMWRAFSLSTFLPAGFQFFEFQFSPVKL
jgi:hypothetical protein